MIKRLLTLVFALVLMNNVFAQIVNPAKWEYKIKQTTATEAELQFIVKLDPEWHIYPVIEVADGPLPTVFNFPKINGYSLVGTTKDPANGHPDKMWEEQGVTVNSFGGTVTFRQKIKILTKKKFDLVVPVSYMVCNSGQCVPGDYTDKFTINANSTETAIFDENAEPIPAINPDTIQSSANLGEGISPVKFRFVPKKYSKTEYELTIRSQVDTGWFLSSKNDAKYPLTFKFELPKGVVLKGTTTYPKPNAKGNLWANAYKFTNDFKQRFVVESGDSLLMKKIKVKLIYAATNDKDLYKTAENNQAEIVDMSLAALQSDPSNTMSYWLTFLIAFLSGFAALLTPCVFPMIPMTVSFFLKQSKNRKKGVRNALTYGAFIIVIYVSLGLIVTSIWGPDSLNALSTNVYFNLFFFVMLVVFAASFLGAFEIVLPSKWVNAADRGADRGGVIGIFFMAFTLALVSFSCTGPIIGTLLVEASQQGVMGPFWGMFGFSLALALPFVLFALFPSWLNSMPSSGGWLNSVKVSLGFLELALAFKFLSNADLVVKAHLLEREMFLAIWIVIFAMWGFYLLGKLKFSHDSDLAYIGIGRLSLSILIFTFVMYLIPGMWGAPVKLVNAFLPASTYSESPCGVGNICPDDEGLPEHAEWGPNQIPVFHDYKYALEYARKVKKPLVIDFTGHACVNCRRMENTVWVEGKVKNILSNDVVVVSLYVDEKTSLPESEHYYSDVIKKTVNTVGRKWSELQTKVYKSNAQPQYFMLDNNEAIMNGSADFQNHGTAPVFEKWLKDGLKQFELFNGSKEVKPVLVKI